MTNEKYNLLIGLRIDNADCKDWTMLNIDTLLCSGDDSHSITDCSNSVRLECVRIGHLAENDLLPLTID
jgi:hypothetical protein